MLVFHVHRKLVLFCVVVACCLTGGWYSCTAGIDKIVKVLDDGIVALDENSEEWQSIMQDVMARVDTINAEVKATVRDQLANAYQRGLSATGAEFRCEMDFIGTRMRYTLEAIRAQLKQEDPPPAPEPTVCQVIPASIDRSLIPDRLSHIELYGFDFDTREITAHLFDVNDEALDITPHLSRPSHYLMTLTLGPGGIPLNHLSREVTIETATAELSTIGVIQNYATVFIAPGKRTYFPPLVKGDRDFFGHGPRVTCTVSLAVVNDDTQIEARIYMKAEETEWGNTTAEGTDAAIIYSAPTGKMITRVVGTLTDSITYVDDSWAEDVFERGDGSPVERYLFIGNSDGPDVGVNTRVIVEYNQLQIEIVGR